MISVVMLNWKRPLNVEHNALAYLKYDLVSEVIVFSNADKPLEFATMPFGLTVIRSTNDLGLYTRFAAASLAVRRCIMHTDDDLFIPEGTLNILYKAWTAAPEVCHSLHGRDVSSGYRFINVYGLVEVALTRCMLVDRVHCAQSLMHVHEFDDLEAHPRGNGEDIILSFVAMRASGRLNVAHDLPLKNYPGHADPIPGEEKLSIHKRWPGHAKHRQQVLHRCREVFGIPASSRGRPEAIFISDPARPAGR